MLKKWMLAALCLGQLSQAQTIAVSQIIEHPALNATYAGLQEALQEAGFQPQYLYENAQGNGGVALQIAEKFAGEKIDVAVGIGTPSAQSLLSTLQGQKPLIFAAVTDPVAAKLVTSWTDTGQNVTGISDSVPVAQNLKLMRDLLPKAKRIGTLYNSGEANSVAAVADLRQAAQEFGFEVREAAAGKTSEVLEAGLSLVGQVDAFYIVQDNVVVSAIHSVVQLGEEHQIPVFAADSGSVRSGAIASYSFDYAEVGRSAGKQIVQFLNGQPIAEIPVGTPENIQLILNLPAAEKMGVKLPEALLQQAHEVLR